MSSKIRIAARLRPYIVGEIEDDAVAVLHEPEGNSCITVLHPKDNTQHFKYPFSSCYGASSTQEEIYDRDVKPLIDIVYSGVVVTVFAYGVTSSGKTHTMQGTRTQSGIIPRVVKDLFERKSSITQYEVFISVSYMEIYKDDVYDLMVERDAAPKLPVRERGDGQVFVANLSTHPISDIKDFEKIFSAASKRRSTGATNLNRASSRSHAILTITVDIIDRAANQMMSGKINLVDLAGSENNKLTGNDPARMAESAAINKSLSVLGQVVHALNQGAPRIPYRDSKLTRILQDALGGSAVGLLICNLAPGLKFRQDTLNTLNFATRTKEIENRPVVNVRDTQPMQKVHFAALVPPPVQLPAAKIVATDAPRPSARPSLVPTAGPSRLPAPTHGRLSIAGFQPLTLTGYDGSRRASSGSVSAGMPNGENQNAGLGLTAEELDERISKAVEAEVARRLAEKEKERVEQELNRRSAETSQNTEASISTNIALQPPSFPSGTLTPIIKRHQDLDAELNRRLQELEQRYLEGQGDRFAEIMSPTSKKKLGRAYVAVARSHSVKGDLQLSLDFYKKAEEYVPDNIKLKERIIELDWAIKHGSDFVPEPKKNKRGGKDKNKDNKGRTRRPAKAATDANAMDAEEDEHHVGGREERPFGEATNSPHKRSAKQMDAGADLETPMKKQRRERQRGKACYGSDDDREDPVQGKAPGRRGRSATAQATN